MRRVEADPGSDTGQARTDQEPDKGTGWLNDAWSRVIAAVISAAAMVAVGFYAGLHAGSPSVIRTPSPSISMTMPTPDNRIGPVVTISGTAHDLRPRQMVWVFVQFMHPDGVPSANVYPVLGPCPVQESRAWACTGVHVGKAGDYGKRFKLWAAIVTDKQAYAYAGLIVSPRGRHWFSPATPSALPHAFGKPGDASVLVTRCTRSRACRAS